jgi:phage terminase large subunit
MNKLVFKPQKVFSPAYNLDTKTIFKERSFFNNAYDYFVDYGGRGGGKTKDKVRSVVLESTIRRVRVLVTREIQNSIDESVKAEIEACIEEEGLSHFFKITEKSITAKNGSKFIFKGIKNNINNIKSIADVDIVIVEEAESVSELSWEKLLPSIRPISGRAIVIVIFNPASELDATWQTWIVNTPERTLLTNCNFPDNKYFPAFLEAQRKHDEKVLPPKRYKNKWFGVPAGSEGDVIIDQDWLKAARFASRHPDWINSGPRRVAYDPAGQGRDSNAVVYADGNCVKEIDEWVKSPDLRKATRRALSMLRHHEAQEFSYDECGGFGDGVSVFVNDNLDGLDKDEEGELIPSYEASVIPFNAGDPVLAPEDQEIKGTEKLPHEIYANQKAHAHGVVAQMLYNTFRFIELGERDIDPEDMISMDIDDDDLWKKIMREMSTALWVKSDSNSKKKVESKKDMKKRTGQESPNINDAIVMLFAPKETESVDFADLFM